MGWEKRGGRRYLYRNQRINGKPVKEYLAAEGPFGDLMALDLARAEEQQSTVRSLARRANAEFRERIGGLLGEAESANARLRTVAEGLLYALGYHKHNRGEWRMNCRIERLAAEIAQLKQNVRAREAASKPLLNFSAPADDAEAVEVFAKARAGDADAQRRIQTFIRERKWVDWLGDMGRQAMYELVWKACAGDPVWQAGITAKVAALHAELLGDNPTVLEELLARRVLNGWLATHALELELTLRTPAELKAREFLDRAFTRAHKRLTDAIRELARVRRLQAPRLLAQLNVAALGVAVAPSRQAPAGEKPALC